jgi:hypothetical protein
MDKIEAKLFVKAVGLVETTIILDDTMTTIKMSIERGQAFNRISAESINAENTKFKAKVMSFTAKDNPLYPSFITITPDERLEEYNAVVLRWWNDRAEEAINQLLDRIAEWLETGKVYRFTIS